MSFRLNLIILSSVLILSCAKLERGVDVTPSPEPVDVSYQGAKNLCPLPEVEGTSTSQELIEEFHLEQGLDSEGLMGWIHGARSGDSLYVFTWRRPDNFFVNIQFPMSSRDPQILEQLSQVKRHDRVRIWGRFMAANAPLVHIMVTRIEVEEVYQGPEHEEEPEWSSALPESILNGHEMVAKVHISADEGKVLVVEANGLVIPVVNPQPALAQDLYRNDVIYLKYQVRRFPQRPPHLEVDVSRAQPLEVVSQIVCGHGEEIELSGPVVMFPRSPQIRLNVFAVRVEEREGIEQNFTLIAGNDPTMEKFMEINQLMQETWDREINSATYERNQFVNHNLRVRIRGKKNVISPAQANPQIVVEELKLEQVIWPFTN